MPRIVLVATLALAVAACTGEDPAPKVAGVRRTQVPGTPVPPPGAPRARLQAGTDSVEGALVRWCEGARCQRPGIGLPERVQLAEGRTLLFVLSAKPSAARFEIARAGRRPVLAAPLRPGDVMAAHAGVGPGTYVVTLRAEWPQRLAMWRFRLGVPRDG